MLILTRKPGESLYIGDVKVTIVELKGHQIRIGIDAPPEIRIYREEIYVQILEENKKAAEASSFSESGLRGLSKQWKESHEKGGRSYPPAGSGDSDDDDSDEKKKPTLGNLSSFSSRTPLGAPRSQGSGSQGAGMQGREPKDGVPTDVVIKRKKKRPDE